MQDGEHDNAGVPEGGAGGVLHQQVHGAPRGPQRYPGRPAPGPHPSCTGRWASSYLHG